MHNVLKFIVALAVAIVVMLVIRAYVFTFCTVTTDNMQPSLHRGDKVIVNRLQRHSIDRGDLVVYGDSAFGISRVAAVGGDTIMVGGDKFVITDHCTGECSCVDCRSYLIVAGNDSAVISGKYIVGKAYPVAFWRKE